jgi:hypothetical protein
MRAMFTPEHAMARMTTVRRRHTAQRPFWVATDATHCAPWKTIPSPHSNPHHSISSM